MQWSATRVRDVLLHPTIEAEREFGNGEVAQIRVELPPALIGKSVNELTIPGDITVAVIVRSGKAILPTLVLQFREGDIRPLPGRPRGLRPLRVLPGDARMKVLIAGGGQRRSASCSPVLFGDACEPSLLERAGIRGMDVVVAATGD